MLNDPAVLVGDKVYYRAIVTNTGAVTDSGVTVSDVGATDFSFNFGNATSTVLAAGATATSNVATVTAVAGDNLDTATVTGTVSIGSTTTTVTATDTADYMGVPSGVQIGGNPPSGNCVSDFSGSPAILEFEYLPGSTVSTSGQGNGSGVAGATGSTPGSSAFIVVSNQPFGTSGGTDYFEGTVASGSNYYANASSTSSGKFLGLIYTDFFASQSAFLEGQSPLQQSTYNASGSNAIGISDTIGSEKLMGYVSVNSHGSYGGHVQ